MSNQEYWNAIAEKAKEIDNNALLRRIYLLSLPYKEAPVEVPLSFYS